MGDVIKGSICFGDDLRCMCLICVYDRCVGRMMFELHCIARIPLWQLDTHSAALGTGIPLSTFGNNKRSTMGERNSFQTHITFFMSLLSRCLNQKVSDSMNGQETAQGNTEV
jgi:hypothetical protein